MERTLSTPPNTAYMLLVSSVAALGGLMFGFDIAIISGTVPFIQEYFRLDELALGWGVSSLLVGCIFGAMFAGRLSDAYGRRRLLIGVALIFGATSVLTALAGTFGVFVAARFAGGIAVGAASMLSPLYIAEVAPFSVRGKLVALNQLTITLGILISYLINYLLHGIGENNWRWMFATGVFPSLVFFALLFFVPESPRWLSRKGRDRQALEILTRIGGEDNARTEMAMILNAAEHADTSVSALLARGSRRVVLIGIVLAILVQISGINTIIDYAPIILRAAGNAIDVALFQTFVIGFINFAFTFVAIFTVDNAGRKPLYITGALGMTGSLALLSVSFLLGEVQGLMGLILILAFIAFFASCIGPVFWVLMSEIFPGRIRGTAMSVAVFTNWFANFLVVLLFPYVLKRFSGAITFGFLAAMSLVMALFTWAFVPETRGKTLEQIEHFWNKPGAG